MPEMLDGAAVPATSSFSYPSAPQVIDELKKTLDYFHKQGGEHVYPMPPTGHQLRELLDFCFAASLETEEGRTVAFTVTFFGDRDVAFPYRLKEPLDVSPQELARLAVALDPSRTRICVAPENTSLQIVGFIHLGEQDAFHGFRQHLFHMSIRVLGPGVMLVKYGTLLLFTYQKGRFAFYAGESGTVEPCITVTYSSKERGPK